MGKKHAHILDRVLDNVIFLDEVFRDRTDDEIPDVPFLDLARSFELRQFNRAGGFAPELGGRPRPSTRPS